jgi:iturin family lipopeptide synthetase A
LHLPELSLRQMEQSKPFAMYDLTLTVNEVENGLLLGWEYNTGIFKSATIQRMAGHFERLLKSLIQFPQESVMKVNMMGDQERASLTERWNQNKVDYPKEKTIIDLLEEQVQATPNHIAIKFGEKQYTYQQLNQLTNQFANYLRGNYGIGTNDLVAIQMERSEKLALTIISVLKTCAAYVPIGTDYPDERVNYILHDTGTKVLINETEVEKFFQVAEDYPAEKTPGNPVPENLAYCIYTSGSTGVPKGVINKHAGLFNRLIWMKEYLNTNGNEVYLQKTPYTFDVSVWEFLLPVISGGTLIIAKPEGHKDPEYLEEIIRNEHVNIVHFVPSMLSVFLQFTGHSDIPGLRHIICSGEELLPKIVTQTRLQLPQTRIHNFYGPTEAAIDVTAFDVTDWDVSNGVTIGKPVANTRIYIVDEALNLQPVSIPGELLISGIQVAKGYLNLDDLTKERFITDPFIPGERVYRTGDIALWEENGMIRYLGRKDNQVKIRGNRIELGSITSKLLQKPGIREAVVTVYKREGVAHELVAYVVADEIQNTTALRKFLSEKVPDYEIPSYFIQLNELPLSANGKIDIKSLPGPEQNKLLTGIAYAAPKNEKEEVLVRIFANELGRSTGEIGVHDNFFDLGANSIKLIKILNEVNKEFDLKLKPVLLFQYTSIKVLADHVFGGSSEEKEEADSNELSDEIDSLMDMMEE